MVNQPPIITELPFSHHSLHKPLKEWYKLWGDYALELAAYHSAKEEDWHIELPIPKTPKGLSPHPLIKDD